jgi:hypothetical protein
MAKKSGNIAARKARVAAAQAATRRAHRRQGWIITGIGGAVVVAVVAAITVVLLTDRSTTTSPDGVPAQPRLTATGRTSAPPWAVPTDAKTAVTAAGLPMLSSEGTAEHIHAHIDVIVDGKKVTVPANIGIDQQTGSISPLHAHDDTGVVHIESPKKVPFSLGQFFTEWQVALGKDRIGNLTNSGSASLAVFVNGKRRTGNPAAITFAAHDEIALVYGTPAQQKNPPSSYRFANGE